VVQESIQALQQMGRAVISQQAAELRQAKYPGGRIQPALGRLR
jgi:hypothetical protein